MSIGDDASGEAIAGGVSEPNLDDDPGRICAASAAAGGDDFDTPTPPNLWRRRARRARREPVLLTTSKDEECRRSRLGRSAIAHLQSRCIAWFDTRDVRQVRVGVLADGWR